MAAALSLRKHGCTDITVVDSILAGENSSRALVIHAATLEVRLFLFISQILYLRHFHEALDEIGCTGRLNELGVKANKGRLWDGFRFHQAVDFNTALQGYTRFPYALIIPQHVTERVLGERLHEEGITVLRPLSVTHLQPNLENDDYTDVFFEGGLLIKARYVVGADGARSTVCFTSVASSEGFADAPYLGQNICKDQVYRPR